MYTRSWQFHLWQRSGGEAEGHAGVDRPEVGHERGQDLLESLAPAFLAVLFGERWQAVFGDDSGGSILDEWHRVVPENEGSNIYTQYC